MFCCSGSSRAAQLPSSPQAQRLLKWMQLIIQLFTLNSDFCKTTSLVVCFYSAPAH